MHGENLKLLLIILDRFCYYCYYGKQSRGLQYRYTDYRYTDNQI